MLTCFTGTSATASSTPSPTSGVSPSASGSASATRSTSRPSASSDSNLGSMPAGNGSSRSEGVLGYWKICFSLLVAFFAGVLVV